MADLRSMRPAAVWASTNGAGCPPRMWRMPEAASTRAPASPSSTRAGTRKPGRRWNRLTTGSSRCSAPSRKTRGSRTRTHRRISAEPAVETGTRNCGKCCSSKCCSPGSTGFPMPRSPMRRNGRAGSGRPQGGSRLHPAVRWTGSFSPGGACGRRAGSTTGCAPWRSPGWKATGRRGLPAEPYGASTTMASPAGAGARVSSSPPGSRGPSSAQALSAPIEVGADDTVDSLVERAQQADGQLDQDDT